MPDRKMDPLVKTDLLAKMAAAAAQAATAADRPAATIGEDYSALLECYVAICNRALDENRNRFPYTEIWQSAWQKHGADTILDCAFYDDRPKFALRLQLGAEMHINIIEKNCAPRRDAWPLTYSGLSRVLASPQDYIDHPARLDWGWLNEVLRMKF